MEPGMSPRDPPTATGGATSNPIYTVTIGGLPSPEGVSGQSFRPQGQGLIAVVNNLKTSGSDSQFSTNPGNAGSNAGCHYSPYTARSTAEVLPPATPLSSNSNFKHSFIKSPPDLMEHRYVPPAHSSGHVQVLTVPSALAQSFQKSPGSNSVSRVPGTVFVAQQTPPGSGFANKILLSPVKLVRTQLPAGKGHTVQLIPVSSACGSTKKTDLAHGSTNSPRAMPMFLTPTTPKSTASANLIGGQITLVPATVLSRGHVTIPPSAGKHAHHHNPALAAGSFPLQPATAQLQIDGMYPVVPGPPFRTDGYHQPGLPPVQNNILDSENRPTKQLQDVDKLVQLAGGYSTIPEPSLPSGPLQPVLFENAQNAMSLIRRPCNCTRSMCLKLYCDCFANGEFCRNCNCVNCHNNAVHEPERGRAIKGILDRNPRAFHPKVGKNPQMEKKHYKGCNCKKSACLKNYCECYEAKVTCGLRCKCSGCCNTDPRRHHLRQNTSRSLLHLASEAETSDHLQDLRGNSLILSPHLQELNNANRGYYCPKYSQFPGSRNHFAKGDSGSGYPSPRPITLEEAFTDLNSQNPWCLIRDDIVEAFAHCTLAEVKSLEDGHEPNERAGEDQLTGASASMSAGVAQTPDPVMAERTVILEFGRCLQQLLKTANQMREENMKAAQKIVADLATVSRSRPSFLPLPPPVQLPSAPVIFDNRQLSHPSHPPPLRPPSETISNLPPSTRVMQPHQLISNDATTGVIANSSNQGEQLLFMPDYGSQESMISIHASQQQHQASAQHQQVQQHHMSIQHQPTQSHQASQQHPDGYGLEPSSSRTDPTQFHSNNTPNNHAIGDTYPANGSNDSELNHTIYLTSNGTVIQSSTRSPAVVLSSVISCDTGGGHQGQTNNPGHHQPQPFDTLVPPGVGGVLSNSLQQIEQSRSQMVAMPTDSLGQHHQPHY